MKNRLIILLLIFPFVFLSQSPTRQEAKDIAQNQIHKLKSSFLLVRLYNKKNVVEALEAKGMMKRANAVKAKQEETNKEIITSFKNFDFCEVYFFYSDNSTDLIKGEYENVTLFNETGVIKESILTGPNFFVADFGVLKNENTRSSDESGENKSGITKVKKYKGDKSSTKRCMFLRDSELNQLDRPFPFRVWFHPTPIQNLSYAEVVERMDEQLSEFYVKNK